MRAPTLPRPGLVEDLQAALATRTARVAVVGQGYVGLSLASGVAAAGLRVTGIDIDAVRVGALTEGTLCVPGVEASAFHAAAATGRLTFTTDAAAIRAADVVVICVPTPVHEGRPDLSMVSAAGAVVGVHLRAGALVVLESTTYPGTTEQLLLPLLEAGGLRAGSDFLLAYSPERIDPGNADYGLRTTPRVVGGLDAAATSAAVAFYELLVDQVHPVSSCTAAELAKLLENTFRMVNIALVNELAVLCAEQGLDVWEVIEAAATKPFGFMPFSPGPGVGGHCIPVDPSYLAWQSRRDVGRPFRLVELSQDLNDQMPAHVVGRVARLLERRGRMLRGSRVLALGVTYKRDVADVRESAPLEVLARLRRRGAEVVFHDPLVPAVELGGEVLERVALDADELAAADIVVLLTDHSAYDLEALVAGSPLLFDARGVTRARGLRAPHVEVL